MRAAFELATPGTHKLSFLVKNHNRVRRFARGMNRVMNIDVTLRVFTNAVRVPISYIGGKPAPVMERFIPMFAFAKDRGTIAGFVGCPKKERCHTSCPGGSEKVASADSHGF